MEGQRQQFQIVTILQQAFLEFLLAGRLESSGSELTLTFLDIFFEDGLRAGNETDIVLQRDCSVAIFLRLAPELLGDLLVELPHAGVAQANLIQCPLYIPLRHMGVFVEV